MPKTSLMLLAFLLSISGFTTSAHAAPPPAGETVELTSYYDIPIGAEISDEVFKRLRMGMAGQELEQIIGRPPTLIKRDKIEGRIFMTVAWHGTKTYLEIYTDDDAVTGWTYGTHSAE